MRRASLALALLFGLLAIAPAYATTVYYQPTPYPLTIADDKQHVLDGWITSQYYGKKFIRDDKLQIGGWGDLYRLYIKFDVVGLPRTVSQAALWLMPSTGTTNPMGVNFNLVTGSWNSTMVWDAQPSVSIIGGRSAPTINNWWGTIITSQYSSWKSGTNNGLRLDPQANNNNFDTFLSSRNASDGYRPILQLDFTAPVTVPNFKMPLPGNVSWLVTTEVGGYDCKGLFDVNHTGSNYFSIDFSWRNKDANGNLNNKYPSSTSNIPILAAADGTVSFAGQDPNLPGNGYFVVIDHGTTGFSTRYLHLRSQPSVVQGRAVAQGDLLGYMGTTGQIWDPNQQKWIPTSTGVHLHFGVRYNNSGDANASGQYAVMDGWLLKSFQSECSNGDYIRYYRSSNRAY